MKARLKNYRQSPRKVRLVANTVRGKSLEEACGLLTFLNKRSALAIKKLILSAAAQGTKDSTQGNLKVKTITVDEGISSPHLVMRARSHTSTQTRRRSHITVVLE